MQNTPELITDVISVINSYQYPKQLAGTIKKYILFSCICLVEIPSLALHRNSTQTAPAQHALIVTSLRSRSVQKLFPLGFSEATSHD